MGLLSGSSSRLASPTSASAAQVRQQSSKRLMDAALLAGHDYFDQSRMDSFSRQLPAAGEADVVGGVFSCKLSVALSQRKSLPAGLCFGGGIRHGAVTQRRAGSPLGRARNCTRELASLSLRRPGSPSLVLDPTSIWIDANCCLDRDAWAGCRGRSVHVSPLLN